MELFIAFVALTALEIVLGVDNIVLSAIQVNRLPEAKRKLAWNIGLIGAGVLRILMLLGVSWIVKLEHPVLSMAGHELSWKDLLLLGGGAYLLFHTVKEMNHKIWSIEHHDETKPAGASFAGAMFTIFSLNLVFSVDSVLTAIGMTNSFPVMAASIVISVVAMMLLAQPLIAFMRRHMELEILALSFLLMVAILLMADAFHIHFPRGFVYVAMAFATGVNVLQLVARSRQARAHD